MVLRKIWEFVLDVFFPPICLNCKSYLEDEDKVNLICKTCFKSIHVYKTVFRSADGLTLAAVSSYNEPTLRELIHYFKYKRFLQAQKPIKEILNNYLKMVPLEMPGALVVPIPLHPSRQRERGFNQSELIAEMVSERLNLPIAKILVRVRKTESQITLPREAREVNMRGSFEVRNGALPLKNKSVVLVDDVYTSGTTIKEAAKVLRRAGVKDITALVLARA